MGKKQENQTYSMWSKQVFSFVNVRLALPSAPLSVSKGVVVLASDRFESKERPKERLT